MIAVGDKVVYRHHVCEVAALRPEYYEGKDYLELHALFENRLKLFISVDEAKPPILRPVMTKDEALALIDSMKDVDITEDEEQIDQNETTTLIDRQIKELYEKHLKTLKPEELLPIMKYARFRSQMRNSQGRNPTVMDKKYLKLAENLLCDELSVSLDIARDEVMDFFINRVRRLEGSVR
ncbi:MAG: CarD family transcriptional regulator [Eggerthellaceae bacterium]|jgi:RNA polymerase-interacting CarD/CdnL/TRCF family regulator